MKIEKRYISDIYVALVEESNGEVIENRGIVRTKLNRPLKNLNRIVDLILK